MGSSGAWETRSVPAGISGSKCHPKGSRSLRYKSPCSKRDSSSESPSLIRLRVRPIHAPLDLHSNNHVTQMFSNNFLEFDINDFTGSNNNGYCDDNLGLDGFNWSGAGPSQPYFGVDVQGDLNDYPNFPTPSTAPTSLYPTNETFSNEGKSCCVFR